MNHVDRVRLLKVLALADSSHEGEAVAAVRVARQLLAREGLSFSDLARNSLLPGCPEASGARVKGLEAELAETRRLMYEAQQQLQDRAVTMAALTHRIRQLEQNAGRTMAEVEKWRSLARDTANKLWDIGQQIAEDRAVSHDAAGTLREMRPAQRILSRPPSPAISRERHFVRNSLLEMPEAANHGRAK